MSESVTIPAHLENGSLHLDAPLPPRVERVEVIAHVAPEKTGSNHWKSVGEFVRSLPPGTRSGADIEAQVREERDSWPE